jgi:hypothetical protein
MTGERHIESHVAPPESASGPNATLARALDCRLVEVDRKELGDLPYGALDPTEIVRLADHLEKNCIRMTDAGPRSEELFQEPNFALNHGRHQRQCVTMFARSPQQKCEIVEWLTNCLQTELPTSG